MFTTLAGLLGTLDILVNAAGQLVLARRSGQEPIVNNTITTLTTGNKTLTAAQLLGGIVEHNATGVSTDTTDTGANLDSAIPTATVGDTFECQLINTGSAAITLAGGTGVTIKGNTAVAASKVCYMMFLKTGTATYNVYPTVSA